MMKTVLPFPTYRYLIKFALIIKSGGITRVITHRGAELREALKNHKTKHGPIKTVGGACSTTFYITDIYNEQDVTLLALVVTGLRKLMPNESYYRLYDDPKYATTNDIDLDADDEED